jgi:hypothetical protein
VALGAVFLLVGGQSAPATMTANKRRKRRHRRARR